MASAKQKLIRLTTISMYQFYYFLRRILFTVIVNPSCPFVFNLSVIVLYMVLFHLIYSIYSIRINFKILGDKIFHCVLREEFFHFTEWLSEYLCERDVVIKGSVDRNIYFDFTVLCIWFHVWMIGYSGAMDCMISANLAIVNGDESDKSLYLHRVSVPDSDE